MRANEIMVGDLFDVHRYECVADGGHFQEWQEYGKIVCITEDYVTVKYIAREEDYGFEDVEHSDLEPIPITADILEENGWRKPQMDYDKEMRCEFLTCDGDWILWINGDSFMFTRKEDFVGHGIELKYVHELQHAMRLCLIEKEIEL